MHKYIQTHSSFYAWKVGKRKKVCEKCEREQKRGGWRRKECNRFNVLIKIPQQSCWYLYLFDFLFCHVAFDSVLCAYWVTPMCHARRPNAPPSQPYLVLPYALKWFCLHNFFSLAFIVENSEYILSYLQAQHVHWIADQNGKRLLSGWPSCEQLASDGRCVFLVV